MSEETLEPPLPPIDARTEAVAERLFGLKWALRKDSTEIIHEEWQTVSEWIRDGYLRQAIEVLAAADQAEPASAKASGYQDRMRVEYRELTARAGRLRDMLQRYADGTLDFEPTCPITLLSRQLDVMTNTPSSSAAGPASNTSASANSASTRPPGTSDERHRRTDPRRHPRLHRPAGRARPVNAPVWPSPHENRQPASQSHERTKGEQAMSNDIDKSVNRLNAAETIRRQAIALQRHISEALADLQTLSGSEDIQISHALTMATIQASKALKQAHLMQDTADMLDQADQRDEENKISRMLMHKIAQQGE